MGQKLVKDDIFRTLFQDHLDTQTSKTVFDPQPLPPSLSPYLPACLPPPHHHYPPFLSSNDSLSPLLPTPSGVGLCVHVSVHVRERARVAR